MEHRDSLPPRYSRVAFNGETPVTPGRVESARDRLGSPGSLLEAVKGQSVQIVGNHGNKTGRAFASIVYPEIAYRGKTAAAYDVGAMGAMDQLVGRAISGGVVVYDMPDISPRLLFNAYEDPRMAAEVLVRAVRWRPNEEIDQERIGNDVGNIIELLGGSPDLIKTYNALAYLDGDEEQFTIRDRNTGKVHFKLTPEEERNVKRAIRSDALIATHRPGLDHVKSLISTLIKTERNPATQGLNAHIPEGVDPNTPYGLESYRLRPGPSLAAKQRFLGEDIRARLVEAQHSGIIVAVADLDALPDDTAKDIYRFSDRNGVRLVTSFSDVATVTSRAQLGRDAVVSVGRLAGPEEESVTKGVGRQPGRKVTGVMTKHGEDQKQITSTIGPVGAFEDGAIQVADPDKVDVIDSNKNFWPDLPFDAELFRPAVHHDTRYPAAEDVRDGEPSVVVSDAIARGVGAAARGVAVAATTIRAKIDSARTLREDHKPDVSVHPNNSSGVPE